MTYIVPARYHTKKSIRIWHDKRKQHVNILGKDITEQIPGGRANPPRTIIIPGAKQSDLEYLYNQGWTNLIKKNPDNNQPVRQRRTFPKEEE